MATRCLLATPPPLQAIAAAAGCAAEGYPTPGFDSDRQVLLESEVASVVQRVVQMDVVPRSAGGEHSAGTGAPSALGRGRRSRR